METVIYRNRGFTAQFWLLLINNFSECLVLRHVKNRGDEWTVFKIAVFSKKKDVVRFFWAIVLVDRLNKNKSVTSLYTSSWTNGSYFKEWHWCNLVHVSGSNKVKPEFCIVQSAVTRSQLHIQGRIKVFGGPMQAYRPDTVMGPTIPFRIVYYLDESSGSSPIVQYSGKIVKLMPVHKVLVFLMNWTSSYIMCLQDKLDLQCLLVPQ